jgi:hypothetical protein
MSPTEPDEMQSLNLQIKVFGMNGKVVISYEDGIMRNIDIYLAKTGSTIHGLFLMISKLVSTILRREKKLDKIIERLDEIEIFEPCGFCSVGNDKHFKADKGYAEFLKILLEKYYKLPEEELGKKQ